MPFALYRGYNVTMRCILKSCSSFLIAFCLAGTAYGQDGQTTFSDPEKTVQDVFWKQLYAEGGKTFFCGKAFSNKGFLITQGYIYPLAHIRSTLKCGTLSQCEKDEHYRYIASDLHNMIPVQSSVELWRRNASYAQLTENQPTEKCDIRATLREIEPPNAVKGDVARAVAYMAKTYHLPLTTAPQILIQWSNDDPPDDHELQINTLIENLQGNSNPFVTDPAQITRISDLVL
ncbi:MAG: endonuclease I [Alteromonadaceae bacterium]|nr:endonuclease I [Alteromonadaceae bacterium]MBH86332.1 endonuclease I [Alteromonadaceae bacterium]|tara:strand:+ start:365 stop:1060 length:696 start_codon:yes stop_codon:yes gene_type:complete